jgi:hypothetical protein
MQAASIPANEAERLQALYDLLILDTPPEERFDTIAGFAAAEFDMPIVLITLVMRSASGSRPRSVRRCAKRGATSPFVRMRS